MNCLDMIPVLKNSMTDDTHSPMYLKFCSIVSCHHRIGKLYKKKTRKKKKRERNAM